MAGFSVKNTTKTSIFDLICPHYCRGCGKIGAVFCECCKNNINTRKIEWHPDRQKDSSLFDGAFMVGWHDEMIGKLVKEYKYNSVRALAEALADLFDMMLPVFMGDVMVVPLPTMSRHIRERGFDHMGLVAKKLAEKRGWKMGKCLVRNKNAVQVGASGDKRREQAKVAYKLNGNIDENAIYLLLDDVWTTGASMTEATKIMKKAGAKKVIIAVLAVNRGNNKGRGFGRIITKGVEDEVNNGIR